MAGSATLTMLVSRISRTTASITPAMSSHWLHSRGAAREPGSAGATSLAFGRLRAAAPVCSADPDTHVDREADREPRLPVGAAREVAVAVLDRFERDAHRDALHDLGEVPGGVVGREERVLRAGGRRERLDPAAEDGVGIGVDAPFCD